MLNNREISLLCWAVVFLGWVLSREDIRESVTQLLALAVQRAILFVLLSMALYGTVMVAFLWGLYLWYPALLKDSILWLCFTGVSLLFRFIPGASHIPRFQDVLIDCVKISIVVEFIANMYPFHLIVELVLTPLASILILLDMVAKRKPETRSVSKLASFLLGCIGVAMMGWAVWHAFSNPADFAAWKTLNAFLLPLLFSISFLPFLYGLVLFCWYEQLFLRLELGSEKTPNLKNYARRRIELHCHLSLSKVRVLAQTKNAEIMHIQSESDVERILACT
jgi:hypothetical protein